MFDFNHASLFDGASNAAVQAYMQGVLSGLGLPSTVTVTGTKVEKNYTGDNYVVGPCTPAPCSAGDTVTSLTLGNSDGNIQHGAPWDGYIYNYDSVKFTMTFPFAISGVSFDYEIFPNAGCPDPPSSCGTPPDFRFRAGTPGDPLPLTSYLYTLAVDPYLVPINGYQYAPVSGPVSKAKAAQWLGVSGYIDLPAVTILEFYDWPERVGIDNLTVETVPEPGTLLLLGTAAAGFLARRKKLHMRDLGFRWFPGVAPPRSRAFHKVRGARL
jgi:hypothetical protein